MAGQLQAISWTSIIFKFLMAENEFENVCKSAFSLSWRHIDIEMSLCIMRYSLMYLIYLLFLLKYTFWKKFFACTFRSYVDKILPESRQRAYFLYAYSNFCYTCMEIEMMWDKIVNDMEAIGRLTSCNGTASLITVPLCRESTANQWIPCTELCTPQV